MEKRILIYAPTGQNAPLTEKVLTLARIECHICHTVGELARQLSLGAGAVLTVEEALSASGFRVLSDYVEHQPNWSDLPILLLTHRGADSVLVRRAVISLGNLTLLERPVRTLTLITVLHAILRARDKQYQVREADRRKDEFLASLGHELRNPLAPIRTSATLLTHLFPQSPPAARIKDVIERQVTHLTRLVDDLLDVARITSGKIALQCDRIAFADVIAHVIELCQQSANAKRIRIERHLPQDEIALHADHARVVQIYSNVLSNAIKFTPQGGTIWIRAWRDDGLLYVSIRDNGIGLEAGAISGIFNMFEQSKTISGQISSGLGIGLSLARQFAQMHGGAIDAYSAGPGQGSEFIISLPALAPAAAVPPSAASPGAAQRGAEVAGARRARVLVVDDNRDAADSLAALFELEHFDVGTVYDGYAAVAAAEEQCPDLIVMDLGMPGMDGYEAARLIRQHPGTERVLMVALTGWGQSDARRRTVDAGFDCHLIKPVDFDEILRLASSRLSQAG
ncbi:MAG: response regulator [Pseudomonadota bacterium]